MEGKDELTGLLQERFTGHELPVDPTVWEGVQAQLVEAAVDADLDLFQDRFNGHESTVDPGVWQHIAGQLGHGAAAGTTVGGGLLGGTGGWIAAGIVAVGLTGGLWWWNSTQGSDMVSQTRDRVEVPAQEPEPAQVTDGSAGMEAQVTTAASDVPDPSPKVGSMSGSTPVPGPALDPVAPAVPVSRDDTDESGTDEMDERHAPVPATMEPRLNSTDTGTQDPRGLAMVERILGEALNETAHHPRPEQIEDIPGTPQDVLVEQNADEGPAMEPAPVVEQVREEFTLFIPNVFSPNNDLTNDELRAQGTGLADVRVRIYNANNNELVFAANSLKPWDGRDLNGEPCPDGYYFYAIEAVTAEGTPITKGQAIRLFR